MSGKKESKNVFSDLASAAKRTAQSAKERQEAEQSDGSIAKMMSAAQRAAERARKREEARRRAVERAQKRQTRPKTRSAGGIPGRMSPAERAQGRKAAKEQSQEQTRKKTRAAGDAHGTTTAARHPGRKPATSGIAGMMSAAQRTAARAKRREQRRTSRPTPSAGVSQKTITASDDAALGEKLAELDAKLSNLYKAVMLSEINDDLEDMDSALTALPVTLESLRSRGYVFKSFLEKKVAVLEEQWDDLQERVLDTVDKRSQQLLQEADKAANLLDQTRGRSGSSAKRMLERCETAIGRLESKVDAAQETIEGMYDTLDNNVTQSQRQMEAIAWALDQVDQACFRSYPAEAVVAACQAQLLERGDDKGPKGIFYLTDERVLFEQKEEIATKKVLFVTTEKKKIQELRFEVPVGDIEELKATEKGRIRHKELLELNFGGDAALRRVHLRLLGGADSQEWQGLIGRVMSGDIAKERTTPKDESVIEAARSAPTECPTCGAQLSQTIVRGMQSITCEYCGCVIRL